MRGLSALVVSGSRGIGRAIALELARRGVAVTITARHPESLKEAAESIERETGNPIQPVVANSRKADERQTAVDLVLKTGRLDLLVYATGINPARNTPAVDMALDTFQRTFDTNVLGALGYVQLAWHAWMKDHGGSVLMLNTVAATSPLRLAAYSATKAALHRLTEDLADQLAPRVRVNAIAPAFVRTTFMDSVTRLPPETIAASYPLGRIGQPSDIATAAAFLLSPLASWITGVTLPVDGGKSVSAVTHDREHPPVDYQVH
ncbi:SDR family oxidoreductase [Amycolatopsis rubida]|nr:SDR family oxidoreductase [Amycolatopsis rubida]MYW93009.1 glucose 1-dehydrogenase [Amycolatopsis rubida]NEC57996.1 SDR family oxidoreductase [Amycolatopsis rubida]